MSENEIDYNTTCSVCFRAYGDNRGRVPRVLPCGHTFCERCIHRSIRWNSARCPACDAKHPAGHGAEGFQQHYQVLAFIRRQGVQQPYEASEASTTFERQSQRDVSQDFTNQATVISKPRYLEEEKREVLPQKVQTKKLILPESTSSQRSSPEKVSSSQKPRQEPHKNEKAINTSKGQENQHRDTYRDTAEPESQWSRQEPHKEVKTHTGTSRENVYHHQLTRDTAEPKSWSQRVKAIHQPHRLQDDKHGMEDRVPQYDPPQEDDFLDPTGTSPVAPETSTPRTQSFEVSPIQKKPVQVLGNVVEVRVRSDKGEILQQLKMFGSEDKDENQNIGASHGAINVQHKDPTGFSNDASRNNMHSKEAVETGVRAWPEHENNGPVVMVQQKPEPREIHALPSMREITSPKVSNTGARSDDARHQGGIENLSKIKVWPDEIRNYPKQYQNKRDDAPMLQKTNPPRVLVSGTGVNRNISQSDKVSETRGSNENVGVISKPRFPDYFKTNGVLKTKYSYVVSEKEPRKPIPQKRNIETKVKDNTTKEQTSPPVNQEIQPAQVPLWDTKRPEPEKRKAVAEPQNWADKVGVIRRPKKQVKELNTDQGKNEMPRKQQQHKIKQNHGKHENQKPKPARAVTEAERIQQVVLRGISWKGPAGRFKCKVTRSIENNYDVLSGMCVLMDRTVVVCGENYGWGRITQYSLRDGQKVESVRMDGASHLTQIQHHGKPYLAISFSKAQTIELHDINDVRKTRHTYHTDPDEPGLLCTSSPYTLLYVDQSSYLRPSEVSALDCRTSKPVFKYTTHTKHTGITDICCVKDGDTSLLVTTFSKPESEDSGIYAYNRKTDGLEWKAVGHLRGMEHPMYPEGLTTDEHGHLFVCDQNNWCIQMFSTDGAYMGAVLRTRDHGMYKPVLTRWCDGLSGLIVVHRGRENMWISLVHLRS